LGVQTNQDYELALMELLSGAGGYLVVDGKMSDVLSAERKAASPNTTRIRDFASSHVALAPEALQQLSGASGGQDTVTAARPSHSTSAPAVRTPSPPPLPPTPPRASEAATVPAVTTATGDSSRRAPKPFKVADAGEDCAYCKGPLPGGREISFCPHCGQDLTLVHCPACGSELERGWKFCVTCGRGSTEV
nr:zinc ribbon domain-containing protein [Gemmatimonadota bacterium]